MHPLEFIPSVSNVFGSHNTLGLDPNIFLEVKIAIRKLREENLVKHGTGLHKFERISVMF
jgi:hypothetical protein